MAADRPGTLFAGEPRKLRAQAAWLLLGPGTPFIYYGNEIAQAQGPERGDVRHRKPLDWEEVARQRQDADSPWRWTQKLIKLRSAHISLRRGKATFLSTHANSDALALWRESGEDVTLTLFNGSGENLDSLVVDLPENSPVQSRAWVLGEGTLPTAEGVALDLGQLAAYGVKVLHLEK
jgi:glycosidase